jgi:hypothetical protein
METTDVVEGLKKKKKSARFVLKASKETILVYDKYLTGLLKRNLPNTCE